MTNSNRQFCVTVMEIIGEGTVNLARRGDAVTRTRWEYQANSGVLRAILPQVIPYLIIKREVADYVLEYLRFVRESYLPSRSAQPIWYYEKLDTLYGIIKRLNEKGKKPIPSADGADTLNI